MSRLRSGFDLINDALERSDNEGADEADGRHPRPKVLRYVNQGGAALWDLLIEARGPDYFRADPAYSITTTADTTSYALPSAFYMLISVALAGDFGTPLVPFSSQEEPMLRLESTTAEGMPVHYQLRRSAAAAGTSSLVVLPVHDAGQTITVEYVPVYTDLLDTRASTFDGVNGWEEFMAIYAARLMAEKDQEWQLLDRLDKALAEVRGRILKLAPKRDMHRAKRVTDVRGPRMAARAVARRWW
jgi:hypothetical protein